MLENHNSLNRTVHRVNSLLSATKSNRQNINSNSEHLLQVQKYLTSLQRRLNWNFKYTTGEIQQLHLKLKIEHALISLEQSTHRIAAYFNKRRRQITSMYHHSLTEDLLPPTQLSEILQKAHSLRFATMPTNWYYENCQVSPVWTSVKDITFRVTLPLHDGKNYISYSLQSFPSPVKMGYKASLKVTRQIAYSSTSGTLFQPILCIGHQTRICRGGALYDSSIFVCERALISKDPSAKRYCKVKIFSTNETLIREPTPGLYIISTPLITPKLHCDGLSERSIRLEAGVFFISLNQTCTLRGLDWTLSGLNKYITPYHLEIEQAPISLRTVFAPYNSTHLQKIAQAPHWTPIHRLPVIALAPLDEPARLLSLRTIGTMTWINSTFLIVVILVGITVAIAVMLCQKYKTILPFLRRPRTPPSAPIELELQPHPAPTPENRTSTLRLPVYPDLGRELPA